MSSESQGETALNGVIHLLGSPAVRNATLTCFAAVGVALSLKSLLSAHDDDKNEGRGGRRSKGDEKHIDLPERRKSGHYFDLPNGGKDGDGNGQQMNDNQYAHRPPNRRDSSSTNAYEGSNMFSPHTARQDRQFGSSSNNSSKSAIAIFWDVDNCQPNSGASGHQVAQAIRRAAQSAGQNPDRPGSIVSFKAYLELSSETLMPNAAQVQLRSELQGSGVSLIDTPKSGRKDVADKMMIADLLSFAIDKRPPALIVLLSGDRDFAYPLGILRNRGYEILLITPPSGATPILEASANYKLRWRQDVLKIDYDANGRPYDKALRVNGTSKPQQLAEEPTTGSAVAKKSSPTDLVPDAVRGPDGTKVPPVFAPLVTVLEQFAAEGAPAPLRSRASIRLQALDPNVFSKAHASGWGEYVAVAEAAGIVVLGPGTQNGREWIALPSNVRQAPEMQAVKREKLEEEAVNTKDLGMFAPLIQAHQNVRRGSASDRDPTVRETCSELDDMVRRGIAGTYKYTGTGPFDLYVKQAFRARIARLAQSENGTVVQLHPKYLDVPTGLDTKKGSSSSSEDTPKAPSTLKPAAEIIYESPSKLSAAIPSTSTTSDPTAATARSAFVASTKSFPHQPSGEVINVAYFPLANFLLTQRGDGTFATREVIVHQHLSKHHKLGRAVQSWQAFQEYLRSALADDVVKFVISDGMRHVVLSDKLCRGEGGDKHKGFVRGQNSNWRSTNGSERDGSPRSTGTSEAGQDQDSTASSSPKLANQSEPPAPAEQPVQVPSKTKVAEETEHFASTVEANDRIQSILEKLEKASSPQFNAVATSVEDRQKFKPLVDALVSIRKRGFARALRGATNDADFETIIVSAIEPLRGAVATTLVEVSANAATDASNGTSLATVKAPGAWVQSMGYASFTDFYNEAERKGFVHLISHEAKERIRLAKRYEEMFFSS